MGGDAGTQAILTEWQSFVLSSLEPQSPAERERATAEPLVFESHEPRILNFSLEQLKKHGLWLRLNWNEQVAYCRALIDQHQVRNDPKLTSIIVALKCELLGLMQAHAQHQTTSLVYYNTAEVVRRSREAERRAIEIAQEQFDTDPEAESFLVAVLED